VPFQIAAVASRTTAGDRSWKPTTDIIEFVSIDKTVVDPDHKAYPARHQKNAIAFEKPVEDSTTFFKVCTDPTKWYTHDDLLLALRPRHESSRDAPVSHTLLQAELPDGLGDFLRVSV